MTDLRQIRDRFEIGMGEAQRAHIIANERFEGDIRLGVAWIHANALAINVRGGPDARAQWNDEWARSAIAGGQFA